MVSVGFELQKAQKSEYSKYRKIIHKSLFFHIVESYGKWSETECTKGFEENDNFFIKIDGKITGILSLEEREKCLFVVNIIFLPEFTGLGFGPKIFNKIVFPKAKKLNKPVELSVHLSNKRAKKFYETKLKFKQFDETKTHFLMRKEM